MKPITERDPSEELTPRAARRQFLNAKRGNVKESSYRAYKFPTRHFVEYCENEGIDAIGQVNSYLMESWVQKREAEDVKPITAQQTVKLVRVFIKWCENSGLIEPGVYDRTRVPNVSEKEQVSQEVLRAHAANQILDYLSTYEYATRQHALFQLMWETASRISGAISLDLEDLGRDREGDPALTFVHREAQGTPLKNNEKSERTIQLSEGLFDVLQDYIEMRRPDVTDEYGRNPLFTTANGRLTRQRAYKNTVALTRPCVYAGQCPANKDIETCEFTKKKRAMSCPENVSLHPIRRGSITDHINRGWPKELLSERVDVSVEVLEKHYDARTQEDALRRRKQYRDLL
ncbi:tyrosine-type recombinase/integrase [Salinilacihabitans rarus]|uniref:tyrosine-type recombinase/integrase n=1 Tax=Salinilacihabitans rarus TaxID=2961596 RepID=UPI0020C902EE|nr:tyrosine-type recombinase/integrase [Salinilacihabitans rarus]